MARKAGSLVSPQRSKTPEIKPGAEPAQARDSTNLRLKILVFWAGAVLMGLEIAGSRVLAPHFGNSIFVWGSLITVFLAALSVGYYLGGRIADWHPSHVLLSLICMAVSVWIVGLSLFGSALCQSLLSQGAGEESGPLLASLMLFLPPSVGMGAVSPFAIRLTASSIGSVGKISGSLYALSTLGSIAGTMLTTFVLIPIVGVSVILRGLGISLFIAALLVLPSIRKNGLAAGIGAMVILFTVLAAPMVAGRSIGPSERLVIDIATPYHNIAVVDNLRDNSRQLRFDRFTESFIVNAPPYPSWGYTNYFNLAFLLKPEMKRALFIGAGGGIGPRAFQMHRPEMQIDVVDIDPKVLETAKKHFYLEDSPQIRLIAEDGRLFVRNTDERYDSILLDAFTIGGRIPFHLATKEFFQLCKEKLAKDGIFVMNINSALNGPLSAIFRSVYHTLREVFPQVYVFALREEQRGPEQSTNILLVATDRERALTAEEWHDLAARYRSSSYIDQPRMSEMLQDLVVDPPDVSTAPVFTDDYAPIETMRF